MRTVKKTLTWYFSLLECFPFHWDTKSLSIKFIHIDWKEPWRLSGVGKISSSGRGFFCVFWETPVLSLTRVLAAATVRTSIWGTVGHPATVSAPSTITLTWINREPPITSVWMIWTIIRIRATGHWTWYTTGSPARVSCHGKWDNLTERTKINGWIP